MVDSQCIFADYLPEGENDEHCECGGNRLREAWGCLEVYLQQKQARSCLLPARAGSPTASARTLLTFTVKYRCLFSY